MINGANPIIQQGTTTGFNPTFNYGIVHSPQSIRLYSQLDYTNSSVAYAIAGSHYCDLQFISTATAPHTFGLDASPATFSRAAVRLGISDGSNGQWIAAGAAGGTSEIQLLSLSSGNHVLLGSTSAADVLVQNNFLPASDNMYSLGDSSHRFKEVFAVKGSITVTSSPEMKTDIAPLPPMLSIVQQISPVSFRWRSGKTEYEEQNFEEFVDEYEEIVEHVTESTLRDGVATRIDGQLTRVLPVYDDYPVYDANGTPLYVPSRLAAGGSSDSGQGTVPVEERRPWIHREPRKIKRTVKRRVPVEVPDPQTQFGFLAPDFKRVSDAFGIDFGGYVSGPEGMEGLRSDQQIAILWRAVQELAEMVAALRAQV